MNNITNNPLFITLFIISVYFLFERYYRPRTKLSIKEIAIKMLYSFIILFIICLSYGSYVVMHKPSKVYDEILLVGKTNMNRPKPSMLGGAYTFDGYATNIDRYRSYGENTFNKIGFNPFEDNELYFNANTDGFDDFRRMSKQWFVLLGQSFIYSFSQISDFFKGTHGLFDPFEEMMDNYDEAMRIGLSTRGGFAEFITNAFLYSAYPMGRFLFYLTFIPIILIGINRFSLFLNTTKL
jgi:hypothetical protein